MKFSSISILDLKYPTTNTRIHTITTRIANSLDSFLSCFCKGVSLASTLSRLVAILPISVSLPVAVTSPLPWPYVTIDEEKAKLSLSPIPTSLSNSTWESFSTATDSPVREDSSICRLLDSKSLISAGIISPVSMITISPGTSSSAFTFFLPPSLMMVASGELIFWRAATESSARPSWIIDIIALITTIAIIITASTVSPVKADTIDANTKRITIGSAICSMIFLAKDFLFDDSITFGPNFSSLCLASSEVRPRFGSLLCFLITSFKLPL